MKEKNLKLGKRAWMYLIIGVCVVLLAAAIVTTVLVLNNRPSIPVDGDQTQTDQDPDGNGDEDPDGDGDGQQTGTEVTYVAPLSEVNVLHSYGFYYNSTLDRYYEHTGVDFTAEVGTSVFAVADGTVSEITLSDVLEGNRIVIQHADGVESVYTFLDVAESLSVGDSVKQGEVIGTVAEPTGEEYRDGAHLHFEMVVANALADPDNYLDLGEK